MNKKDKIYNCLNCDSIIPFKGYSHSHMYCDNKCQLELRSKQAFIKNKQLFLEGKLHNRPAIRKILTDIRGYKCECCGIEDWQGNAIVLQVDHINGDPYNDDPKNLRLLCPNCHSQTDSFAGANVGKGRWSKEGLAKYYQR